MSQDVQGELSEPEVIRRLVRELGAAGGARVATPDDIARLRDFFAHRVLRSTVDAYIQAKYDEHVVERREWPDDTEPEEYLESLRETVLDTGNSLYLTDRSGSTDWTIYFASSVRRRWRGASGSSRIVVLFNAERHLFITGFQPSDGDAYVAGRGGFWVHQR